MSDPGTGKDTPKRAGKILAGIILAMIGVFILLLLALGIYLATPLPARHLSRFATSYLHQNFTVDRVQLSGTTFYLRNPRLANPPGFPEGNLAEAKSVAIAPQWIDLLRGRQRFRLIALEGININLDKNSKGVWNFGPLRQLLASRKPSPAETAIRQFVVKDGALRVGDQGLKGIALQIFNLTTKGSENSTVDLSFDDAWQNRFALKGKARPGTDPALDVTLTAPALSLKGVAALLKLKRPEQFQDGKGSLEINTSLHKGALSAAGRFTFSQISYAVASKSFPVAGSLEFLADYDLKEDAVRLQRSTLTVNNLVQMHATGHMVGVKKERRFKLELGANDIDLEAVNALVPAQLRKDLAFGGRLGCRTFRVEGDGSTGITAASGVLRLQDGALTRGGRLLVAGLSATIGLSRVPAGILAQGRFSTSGSAEMSLPQRAREPQPRRAGKPKLQTAGKPLLQYLDLPLALTLSRRLKPLRAEIPSLSARVMDIAVTGRIGFDASKERALTVSLKVPVTRLSAFNPLLERYDVHATAGTASADLNAAVKNPRDLDATARVQLADCQGRRGKDTFAVRNGSVTSKVREGEGHLSVQGEARLKTLAFNGKGGDASFGYRVADGMAFLDGVDASIAGARVGIAHLSAAIPPKRTGASTRMPTPISLDFDGGAVRLRDLEVSSLAGRMRGDLHSDAAGTWLQGTADLRAGRVIWQTKAVAAPAARVAFSRPGAKAELQGQLLGGTLGGWASFNPFAPDAGVGFDLRLKDAGIAAAAPFLPKGAAVHPADGAFDLHCSGAYSRRGGLSCRFDSKGSKIALTGTGGKKLLSEAGLSVAGSLAADRLSITDAVLSPGAGVAVKLKGAVDRPFSAQRVGTLHFSLPETGLNTMVDPVVDLLPRLVQEATLDGTLAADGSLDLRDGKTLLDGALVFKGGRFEVASQKLLLADIQGNFPVSLDLSGKAGGKPRGEVNFSRENYPRLLEQLRKGGRGGGQLLSVGKISLGALQLGALTLRVAAANGLTEITSLSSSLYEGTLLGKGYLTMKDGLTYRGDLLINGLSLKKLCSIFPGIQGYISGRVDGVISVSGGSKGLAGLTGFTELWAREGGGEKMVVSKEFLQRLSKQKLSGFFFRSDRPYDKAEIKAVLEQGDLSFDALRIVHTNLLGVRDLSVNIASTQNRIALDHLFDSIKEAAVRGKPTTGGKAPSGAPAEAPAEAPATQEFKWGE